MEWVRCNSCGYYPCSLTRLSIFLTSCGHLVCSKCLERADATGIKPGTVVCLQCRQPCKTVKLGPDSQPGPEVTFYFGDEVSAVKKLLQTVQFQKMHYELGTEMAKRKRLLWEIKEGERQEKELVDLGVTLDKLKTPLANVLESVGEKARRASSIQLPHPQGCTISRRSDSTNNSPLCSPVQQQMHSNNIQLQQPPPTLRTRPPYPFNAATNQPNQSFNPRSPAAQQHTRSAVLSLSTPLMSKPVTTVPGVDPRVIARSPAPQHVGTASPFSTPLMPKLATAPGNGITRSLPTQHGAIPAVDPRLNPNLLNWSQSQHQQRQSLAPGVGGVMTPIQNVGPHHMHGYHTGKTANFGVQQHTIHPLNSVRSMHASLNATGITGRTMVPGSVLSQAAPH